MKAVENGTSSLFASWLKVGVGIGSVLFMAFTLLPAFDQNANGTQSKAKRIYASRSPVTVLQKPVDYRVIRERNLLVTDLAKEMSRLVSRLVR